MKPITVEQCRQKWDDTSNYNNVLRFEIREEVIILFYPDVGGWGDPELRIGNTLCVEKPTTEEIDALFKVLRIQ